MNWEATSGFVPGHWRLVTPAAKPERTRRESDATVACGSRFRVGRTEPVARTRPFASIVTWYGARFPPATPKTIRCG
ncbi:MAG: hypothetical protein ACJ75G_12305 [Gaiellaceae bacterium]